MGVDLRDLLRSRNRSLSDLSGCVLAIDAYNTLYQFLAIIRGQTGDQLKDRFGRVTSHLSGLFYRNVNFLTLGIKPIYILDGQPPALKAQEIQRRMEIKKDASAKYAEALARGEKEEARKYAQATARVEAYMVEDTERILNLMGLPWIVAPSEGEATAAHLTNIGMAWAAASQDYDSLLFGAKRLVRNVTISGKRKLPKKNIYVEVEPEEIVLQEGCSDLGISREQLVDIGILLGTDFNPDGFPRIGQKKAYNLIKKYGRIESIPEIKDQLSTIDVDAIRQIFLNPQVVTPNEIDWHPMDEEGIVKFLCEERDFSEERIRNGLDRLKKTGEGQTTTLERWFS